MRYVVIDLQGNQRESFDSRDELFEELREMSEDPRMLEALYVLTHADDGSEVKPALRADEMLLEGRGIL